MAGITPPSPKLRARREAVQGTGGQGGDDVRVADGEGEVGVSSFGERLSNERLI